MAEHEPIRILSAGAPKTGVSLCAETYCRKAGVPFEIEFATGPVIRERAEAGEAAADVIVAPAPAMRNFAADGRVAAGTVADIGSVEAGVAVRDGAAAPDLSDEDSLRAALLAADRIVYNRASSGQYIADMIEKLGIADAVADKTVRVANGKAAMEFLAADTGERTIGFGQVTEIRLQEKLGVRLVGPLPAAVGKTTAYAVGAAATAADAGHAAGLAAFMASPEGQRIFAETGVTPATA
jgi:molybdate transport system substrate-binding protein